MRTDPRRRAAGAAEAGADGEGGEVGQGVSELERGAQDVEQSARREEQRPGYRRLARAGLVARAVVYLLIGGLTFEIAVAGRSNAGADSRGAFAEIARQPGGRELLSLLAAGLLAYASWRVVQAAAGQQGGGSAGKQGGGSAGKQGGGSAGQRRGGSAGQRRGRSGAGSGGGAAQRRFGLQTRTWQRLGWLASGLAYVALFAEAIDIVVGSSSSGGPGEHPEPFVAAVLRAPAGVGWVALVGAAIAAGGVALAAWGVAHDYDKVLRAEEMSRRSHAAARATGIAGDVARACAIVLVAAYLFEAAVTNDPGQARAVDAALQSLVGLPGGRELLGLIAAGMLAFSIYSLVEARYRRV